MEDSVHVKGLSDLNRFLEQLTPKVEANVMRGALRAGMNVIKPIAQANIHSVSGKLAKGLRVGTRRSGGTVTARLRATGPHARVAHLVEYGTRLHSILAKPSGWLVFRGLNYGPPWWRPTFTKEVLHPGTRPNPFMRPALDGQAQAATIAAGEYIKRRLATKEGLDTAHIIIEGDE
jgi:HK97 gp10 family phage protein